jgi:predicted nucleotide-binding protein
MTRPRVFISYARHDSVFAEQLANCLRANGAEVWIDIESLSPGQDWRQEIRKGLEEADLFVALVTARSLASAYVQSEIMAALNMGSLVVPVILEPAAIADIPPALRNIQWLEVPDTPGTDRVTAIAERLVALLNRAGAKKPSNPEEVAKLAATLHAHLGGRDRQPEVAENEERPDSIFIVHGHDDEMLRQVVDYVRSLGITPIVMKDVGGAEQSLFQRFLRFGQEANFALVLMSADDVGASREQFEEPEVGDRSLQFRSRQNVILELGFFYGRLGWENVFVLQRSANRKFPNFEPPSDLGGVIFDKFSSDEKWKTVLRQRLVSHGFELRGSIA